MKVIAFDMFLSDAPVILHIEGHGAIEVKVPMVDMEAILSQSDFISLHVPKQASGAAVLGEQELAKCKKGVILVNTSRGGVIEEAALMNSISSGHVGAAALDVFVGEPKPNVVLLTHKGILSTPHIGASTNEAQERIGLEIAERVKEIMKL
jgi:D-3-phosphoglycerate dehydrogenase